VNQVTVKAFINKPRDSFNYMYKWAHLEQGK